MIIWIMEELEEELLSTLLKRKISWNGEMIEGQSYQLLHITFSLVYYVVSAISQYYARESRMGPGC